MNHSEEMKLMYYHFAVALEKTSELVSLIKHPEHLKFVEAASSQCSCTRTLESFRYVHRLRQLSHFPIIQKKWPPSKRWSFKKSPKLMPVHQMTEVSHLKSKGKQKLSWLNFGISVKSV